MTKAMKVEMGSEEIDIEREELTVTVTVKGEKGEVTRDGLGIRWTYVWKSGGIVPSVGG